MTVRHEDLPILSEPYPLTSEQSDAFQRDGHVHLRGVASPAEVAAYRPVLAEAVEAESRDVAPMAERDTYGKAFLQITNLWERYEAVKRFVLARRFAGIAAGLMGVDAVRLYHDQALYKEAHGGPTPWHQDQYYWPLDTNHTVTMWMPLVDVPVEMGALTFASGSHKDGLYRHITISDESEDFYGDLVKSRGFEIACSPLSAGDATFHSGWTLHNAPGNNTDRMREVMTIIYFADGTRLLEPDNPNRQKDLARWLPGQKPGELAASPLNPVVYP